MRMVSRIAEIEVSLTRNEAEALLLENEWIKSLQPRYNILLRDDKSYPWIMITKSHEFPRIAFHRGGRDRRNDYFGPFPSAASVRQSINQIQKLFRLRNCEDSYFAHRRRPCLQYQIRRCTAPCVDLVSAKDYATQIEDAILFLKGRNQKIISRLIARMEGAAARQEYESAAMYRDQINALKQMQARQAVSESYGDTDFIALAEGQGRYCVEVVSFRGGRNLGQRNHFPAQTEGREPAEVMEAFLGQYFRERVPPAQLVVSEAVESRDLLENVFSERAGRRVGIQPRPRGNRRKMLELARKNADQALQMRLASAANISHQYDALAELLALDEPPAQVDCFDISHTAGNQAVGACVVFDAEGPVKSAYRRYNLKDITPGDDYAAMKQVLSRRYGRIQAEEGRMPDLIMIDGGKGQLSQALDVLDELGLSDVPFGRDRQGSLAARRIRAVGCGQALAQLPAGSGVSGIAPGAADSRRGAPIRHNRAPRPAPEGINPFRARTHSRYRTAAAAQSAQPFRRAARREQGRCGRAGQCAGHQPGIGRADFSRTSLTGRPFSASDAWACFAGL